MHVILTACRHRGVIGFGARPGFGAAGVLIGLVSVASSCGPESASEVAPTPSADTAAPGIESLMPDATPEAIGAHLDWAEAHRVQTDALSRHFPEMTWEQAYEVQKLRFATRQNADPVAGWKIGWSAQWDPAVPVRPAFGPVAGSLVFSPDEPLDAGRFVNASPGVEAEVVFWLAEDLPPSPDGPLKREDIAAAVRGVAAAIDFVNPRVGPHGADGPDTRAHGVADNVYAAGVVLPSATVPIDSVDWSRVTGRLTIDGEVRGEAKATVIMGRDPLEALVWLANEMHTYGHRLQAGQFVVTGTVLTPVGATSGDTATVSFTELGEVSISFTDGATE